MFPSIRNGLKKLGIYSDYSVYNMIADPDNNDLIVNKIINKICELRGYSRYNAYRFRYASRRKIMKFYRNRIKSIKCKLFGHSFVDSSYWSGHSETCYYCGLKHMITRSVTTNADGTKDAHLDQNDKYYYT